MEKNHPEPGTNTVVEPTNESHINTWKDLFQATNDTNNLLTLHKNKFIEYDKIKDDIFSTPWNTDFEKEKNSLPNKIAYRIWETIFLSPEPYRHEFDLDGMTNTQKDKIADEKSNRKKYLNSLTIHILTVYRKSFVVNDRFILKCFEHNMENVLFFILDNEKFYEKDISTTSLEDLYILFAIDTNNATILIRLLHKINLAHLEYAVRFATFDLLIILWKIRKWIPDFDMNMSFLSNEIKGKDWKQHKFFDWWKNHK